MGRIEEKIESTKKLLTFSNIANSLLRDYFSIYYVDLSCDFYLEYRAGELDAIYDFKKAGFDFFENCKKNLANLLSKDDYEDFFSKFTKDNIISVISQNKPFTLNYFYYVNNEKHYAAMKLIKLDLKSNDHVLIVTTNIDAQMKMQEEFIKTTKEKVTFSAISQCLASDYFAIYYVNIVTDDFIEFYAKDDYNNMNIEKSGTDFFATSRVNINRVIDPADKARMLKEFTKEKVLASVNKGITFSLSYRLIYNGVSTHVLMKVNKFDNEYIVIGVSNIEAQYKKEIDIARELNKAKMLANTDALTGVKSKHAFISYEEEINREIVSGIVNPFAICMCDLNGLKHVNDTLGHSAGDDYIRLGCHYICDTFKHSPVFRIGGDEFVLVLQGYDYDHVEELAQKILDISLDKRSGVVLACGYGVYEPGKDELVGDVFDRADTKMYENKRYLKGLE